MSVTQTVYHAGIPVDLAAPSRQQIGTSQFFCGDNRSHVFTALVGDTDHPETGLRSGSVTGAVLRHDGVTVVLAGEKGAATVPTVYPNGKAANATACSVTLPQECFAVPGPILITIKLVDGETVTSVLNIGGTVIRVETDSAVDPGEIIPDVSTLAASARAALAAAEEANTAAAAAEDAATDAEAVVGRVDAAITDAESAAESAYAAVDDATAAANEAYDKAQAANTAAQAANTAAQAANTAATAAGTAATAADTAATAAGTAATAADTAAQAATTAAANAESKGDYALVRANAAIEATNQAVVAALEATTAAETAGTEADAAHTQAMAAATAAQQARAAAGQANTSATRADNSATAADTAAQAANAAAAAASAAMAGAVRYDEAQTLTEAQAAQARENIGAASAGDIPTGAVRYDEAQALTDAQKTQARANIGVDSTDALDAAIPLPARNFLRVGCIGDSYAEGYVNLGNTPAGSISTCAWPYFLSKLTGHEWTNFGIHASGVKTWVEGTGGLTRLAEVQAAGNVCQAYVIGLMLNDCKPGLTAYTPVGTAEDIGTETDSYYAYYYRLIQAVHAVNPPAPIFCLTCPGTDHDSKLIPYNTALRDLAAICKQQGLPVYLCDLDGADYNNSRFFKNPIFSNDYVGGHYTGLGYEMMAECLLRVISDVMTANYADFRTIQQIPYDDNTRITDCEIRIGQLEAHVTPEWLQSVVNTGKASEYFAIGDVINIPWTNYQPTTPVLYNIPFKVVHFGDVYDANNILHRNAMWLQAQYGIPQQMRYDQPEEVVATETTFQSGYYYYVKSGSDYVQQTVTPGAAIPSGTTYYKHPWANAGNVIRYGSSIWSESGYRQWLNGTGGKGAWWTAQHECDLAPYQLATVPGFMYGFTEDWRALFKPVKVTTALNNVCHGNASAISYDRFFLPSLEEVYGVPEVPGAEGVYFEYWKQVTGLSEPSNGSDSDRNDARKIPLLSDTSGSKVTIRLRSAVLSSAMNLYVNGSSGYIADNSTPDQSTFYPMPCCVLY